MPSSPRFNYIITIHNKQDLIQEVLTCILMCCRDNSHVYPVLDGCTDQTESIIDDISATFSHVPITKVYAPDVHEIRSINAGLRAADQAGEGYNIILQDDVMLRDFMWESKVLKLYQWAGEKLGFVSFRLGANFIKDAATSESVEPFTEQVENAYGHGLRTASVLLPGQLTYRSIAIKSPVCIPFKLTQEIGLLDDRLAPYMCDDIEYSIRCLKAGYQNAVFGLRFQSDVDWGSTRTNPSPQLNELEKRNIRLIREWHHSTIADICTREQPTAVVEVPDTSSEFEKTHAIEVWEKNCQLLDEFIDRQSKVDILSRVKQSLKKSISSMRNEFAH